jgi:hypothetical protein
MNIVQTSIAIGLVTVGMGCGAATLPPEQLSSTQSSMRAAQELGATNVPQADLHLRLAKEEVAQAQKFAEDGDEDLGKMQLDRAKADADLSVALARQATAQKSLDEINKNATAAGTPATATASAAAATAPAANSTTPTATTTTTAPVSAPAPTVKAER